MFRVIRIKRTGIDLPAGHVVDFYDKDIEESAKQVCSYLWGKDLDNYLVIKSGNELELPSRVLGEIKKFLIEA